MPPNSHEAALWLSLQREVYTFYELGQYVEALRVAEKIYTIDAARTDNLLMMGAISFQLRNFSEAIFYNQQALYVEPQFAEAYSNIANALRELGDVRGSMQFYLKAIKQKPRFADAYNNLASTHMQLGQIEDAVETYQMALVINPKLVDAHCNLGNLMKARGRLLAARGCYLEAIRLNPEFAIAWSNLAGIFKDEGEPSTAIAYYREAIRLCPPFSDVYNNLGSAMQDQGNLLEANQCYQTAIQLRPDFAVAHANLGSSLLASGDAVGAVRALRHAIQLEPNFPDAYNNLGNALRNLTRSLSLSSSRDGADKAVAQHEAITCYRKALRLRPDHPHAYTNLGCALRDRGLVREAIHCNVTAARIMPSFAPAHANLGSFLREQDQLEQAIAHYHQAIILDPNFLEAYISLGNTYLELSQLDDATKCYTVALKVAPRSPEAHAALAAVHGVGGNHEDAIACYNQALSLKPIFPDAYAGLCRAKNSICDWTSWKLHLDQLSAILEAQLASDDYDDSLLDAAQMPSNVTNRTHHPGTYYKDINTFHGDLPCVQPLEALTLTTVLATRDVQRLTRRFAAQRRASLTLEGAIPFQHYHPFIDKKRIHIGYLCSNFGESAAGQLMMPLLEYHDHSRFFVTCYSLTPPQISPWHEKVKHSVEGGLKDLSLLSPSDAARVIHSDGVQLLLHLDGHTANARNEILSLRPAPIQVWFVLGFCGTSGADYVDYLVADRVVLGHSSRQTSTFGTPRDIDEHVLVLPHSCILNGHSVAYREVLDYPDALPGRASLGVPEDAFVFAYFGEANKIEPIIFGIWINILKRVPNSILWLCRLSECAIANLKKQIRDHFLNEDRVLFTQPAPRRESIYRNALVDLVLDSPCSNALDDTLDALWAGTPVVTFLGNTIATRVSASMCAAADCPDLVTRSLDEYEELAVSLAINATKYWSLRQRLHDARRDQKRAPLFEVKNHILHLEAGIETIWARFIAHKPPIDINVMDNTTDNATDNVAGSAAIAG